MRSPPAEADLAPADLLTALAEGWRLEAASLEYVPEGGGSHHWKLIDTRGRPYFITVDDLDDKEWLGSTREAVENGLSQALNAAAILRHQAGLDFVVAPIGGRDGELLRRLDARHTVSVFPFLAGHSYPFGPYPEPELRASALDMIAALHQASTAVRGQAPQHVLSFGDRRDLDAFLLDPERPWDGGPFSEAARRLMVARAADIAELVASFHHLVDATSPARANPVITHGEPHPANLMRTGTRLVLIDWDTAAFAPPERDVALIASTANEGVDRYQEATGRALDPAVITLYRLRWYLDDLASAMRMFRNRHSDTADTRGWQRGIEPQLDRLSAWLDLASRTCGERRR